MEEICANCRYWWEPLERCRRNPPVDQVLIDGEVVSFWPHVGADQWCGEWAAMEKEQD